MKINLKGIGQVAVETPCSIIDLILRANPEVLNTFCAAKIDGKVVDLRDTISEDCEIELLDKDAPESLPILRHTTAHIMAEAVKHLYPEVVDLLLRDVFQHVETIDVGLTYADVVEVGEGGAGSYFRDGIVVLGRLVGVVEFGHIQHLGGGAHVHAAVSHALHIESVGEERLVVLAGGNLLAGSGLCVVALGLHLFDHVLLDGHGQSVVLGGQCAVELRNGESLLVVAIHLVADVQRDDRTAFLLQIVGFDKYLARLASLP